MEKRVRCFVKQRCKFKIRRNFDFLWSRNYRPIETSCALRRALWIFQGTKHKRDAAIAICYNAERVSRNNRKETKRRNLFVRFKPNRTALRESNLGLWIFISSIVITTLDTSIAFEFLNFHHLSDDKYRETKEAKRRVRFKTEQPAIMREKYKWYKRISAILCIALRSSVTQYCGNRPPKIK